MFKPIQSLNSLLGAVISLVVLGLLTAAGWFGFTTYFGERWARQAVESRLKQREAEIVSLKKDLLRLETAVRLLKVDHRVARLEVVSQQGSAAKGDLRTTINFVEVDEIGRPLETPREFTVEGDIVHVDALVVKFNDKSIEEGDPLRSTSLCLFKRIYGDKQQPEQAFAIDKVGSQPVAYRGGKEVSALEKEIWSQFWDYANDAEKATKAGIRAAHGEGVFQKMVPEKRYRIQLRASDGLSIVPEDGPAKAATGTF